jgi:hypothetical protein
MWYFPKKGHGQQNCPLVTKYSVVPLQKNNIQIRETFAKNLSIITKYATNHRPLNDQQTVFTELPALKLERSERFGRSSTLSHQQFTV